MILEEGRGVPVSKEEAGTWYRTAAEKGYPEVMYKLSHYLSDTKGNASGVKEAVHWAFIALQKGHEQTNKELITQAGALRS